MSDIPLSSKERVTSWLRQELADGDAYLGHHPDSLDELAQQGMRREALLLVTSSGDVEDSEVQRLAAECERLEGEINTRWKVYVENGYRLPAEWVCEACGAQNAQTVTTTVLHCGKCETLRRTLKPAAGGSQVETAGKHADLVRAIFERHDRCSKLLWGPVALPGMMLGPEDADAAHHDRGTLLSLLNAEQRGDVETAAPHPDEARLDLIAAEYLHLIPFDMPTGQGDADVGWRALQSHMGKPDGVEVACVYSDDIREAIDAARVALKSSAPLPDRIMKEPQ